MTKAIMRLLAEYAPPADSDEYEKFAALLGASVSDSLHEQAEMLRARAHGALYRLKGKHGEIYREHRAHARGILRAADVIDPYVDSGDGVVIRKQDDRVVDR